MKQVMVLFLVFFVFSSPLDAKEESMTYDQVQQKRIQELNQRMQELQRQMVQLNQEFETLQNIQSQSKDPSVGHGDANDAKSESEPKQKKRAKVLMEFNVENDEDDSFDRHQSKMKRHHRSPYFMFPPDYFNHDMKRHLEEIQRHLDKMHEQFAKRHHMFKFKFDDFKKNHLDQMSKYKLSFDDHENLVDKAKSYLSRRMGKNGDSLTIKIEMDDDGQKKVTVIKNGKKIANDLNFDEIDSLPEDIQDEVNKLESGRVKIKTFDLDKELFDNGKVKLRLELRDELKDKRDHAPNSY